MEAEVAEQGDEVVLGRDADGGAAGLAVGDGGGGDRDDVGVEVEGGPGGGLGADAAQSHGRVSVGGATGQDTTRGASTFVRARSPVP